MATTPGVPADRIKALRDAFAATMKDPGFLKDANTIHLELSPVSGERLQATVRSVLTTPKRLVERAKAIISGD